MLLVVEDGLRMFKTFSNWSFWNGLNQPPMRRVVILFGTFGFTLGRRAMYLKVSSHGFRLGGRLKSQEIQRPMSEGQKAAAGDDHLAAHRGEFLFWKAGHELWMWCHRERLSLFGRMPESEPECWRCLVLCGNWVPRRSYRILQLVTPWKLHSS